MLIRPIHTDTGVPDLKETCTAAADTSGFFVTSKFVLEPNHNRDTTVAMVSQEVLLSKGWRTVHNVPYTRSINRPFSEVSDLEVLNVGVENSPDQVACAGPHCGAFHNDTARGVYPLPSPQILALARCAARDYRELCDAWQAIPLVSVVAVSDANTAGRGEIVEKLVQTFGSRYVLGNKGMGRSSHCCSLRCTAAARMEEWKVTTRSPAKHPSVTPFSDLQAVSDEHPVGDIAHRRANTSGGEERFVINEGQDLLDDVWEEAGLERRSRSRRGTTAEVSGGTRTRSSMIQR